MSHKNLKIKNTPVVILAGGLGSRISDAKKRIPKCLVKIGGRPIIYHIIKYFQFYGFQKFIICTGFKSKEVDKYFEKTKKLKTFKNIKIDTVFTGINSNTGLRIRKIEKHIKDIFFLTYCDGLTNLNLKKLFNQFLVSKGPSFFEIVIKEGSIDKLDRPKNLKQIKENFIKL